MIEQKGVVNIGGGEWPVMGYADPVAQAKIDSLLAENASLRDRLEPHVPTPRLCKPSDQGHGGGCRCLVIAFEDRLPVLLSIEKSGALYAETETGTYGVDRQKLIKALVELLGTDA